MPRRPRNSTGGLAYHVLNRRVGRLPLFEKPGDFLAFEEILREAYERSGIRIVAYCLMPNHWHLLLWPQADGELSEVMRWVTVTHTQRWHAHRHTSGSGAVYQGRFKSFPIQNDSHFLTVARYVERNAVRANLVARAEEWRWSSGWRRAQNNPGLLAFLAEWPVERPRDWFEWINVAERESDLDDLRCCAQRGRPFGNEEWVERTARQLGLEYVFRERGRPRRS